jgi:hypothetical protein
MKLIRNPLSRPKKGSAKGSNRICLSANVAEYQADKKHLGDYRRCRRIHRHLNGTHVYHGAMPPILFHGMTLFRAQSAVERGFFLWRRASGLP